MADYSVFTKPWQTLPVQDMISVVLKLGYNAIEFPLRNGSQVCPSEAEKKLPGLVAELKDAGIRIDDVASSTDECVFAACAANDIPMIRIMFNIGQGKIFTEQEDDFIRYLDSVVPLCDKYGVKVGVQMHYGRGACNTAEMMRVVGRFDPKHIGAIWDAAHSGLAGEEPEQAIDTCYGHLALVNFKNARYQMYGRSADGAADYQPYFCAGIDGQCSWPRAVAYLKKRGYSGTWCMPAEYTGLSKEQECEYTVRDLTWLKSLVEG